MRTIISKNDTMKTTTTLSVMAKRGMIKNIVERTTTLPNTRKSRGGISKNKIKIFIREILKSTTKSKEKTLT